MQSKVVTLQLLLAVLLATASGGLVAAESLSDPQLFGELAFRHIGPVGNRVPAVVGVPGDPRTYYAGGASGGIFKTEDGGVSWHPVFDDQPAASIGALAIAPSDPNVVWAGTGETFIRSNVSIGNGVYRSTDAGKTWRHLGLEATGRIGRLVVDPRDPDTAFAAAMGHCYGPQPERGLYRTRDGGDTWEQVLFVDEDTGAIDVAFRPDNPRILYAATWQFTMRTAGRTSGGPGSGLFRSTDGGDTWERLQGHGLPDPPWGKIGLATTAARPERVYALIETSSNRDFAPLGKDDDGFQGVLWRSDDGGDSWQLISRDNTLTQRPLYYTRAVAAPDDGDEITFMAVQQSISIDGGSTVRQQNSGWDHHDLWIDPLDGDRRIAGHDGGVSITANRGETWFKPQLPFAQLYHVNVDDRIPYWVYGNRQDGPSMMGPSNSLTGGEIPIGAWSSVGGCEVGFAVPTPGRSEIVWSGCYDGILERFDRRTGQSRDVSVWPLAIESWAAGELRYRFQWTVPIAISPHDPDTIYVGSQHVHRTTDGGQSWQEISPDLTTADPELMRRTGGLTLDDAGPTIAPVVFAIAESQLEPGLIWAGTNDGRLQLTRDGGGSWTDVSTALHRAARGVPEYATISNVEPSRHRAGRLYVAVDGHQEGDTGTWVLRTDDYGKSFELLRSDLPQSVFSYAHCVREDPEVSGLLYLGTHNALWVSFDDGAHWRELRGGLPHAPVSWIALPEQIPDLVISTYGRGFWILDDVTPLRELARGAAETAAPVLLPPRPAYRFRERAAPMSQPGDPAAGENPDYGAFLHVLLPSAPHPPDTKDDVGENTEAVKLSVRIRNAAGELVRELELDDEPGLHRLVWDLLSERTPQVELRTRPRDNPELPLPATGWRALRERGRVPILEPPGRYTVELTRADEVLSSGQLEVLIDPNAGGTVESIAEQQDLARAVRADLERTATLINDIEHIRSQLVELKERLAERDQAQEAAERIDVVERALEEVEHELFDLRLTSAGQDTLRWKRKLYARLAALAGRVQQTDDRPTDQHHAVAELLHRQLDQQLEGYREITEVRIPELNRWLAEAHLAGLVLPPANAEDRQ